MTASHGSQAKPDPIDSQHIAVLRRGGLWPQADVDPAAMRATRALLRRRRPRRRHRAAWPTHVPQTHHPDHLPAFSPHIADQANRDRRAERCAAPAVQTHLAVDRALLGDDDQRLHAVERSMVRTATPHDPATVDQRPSGPGIGTILRLVRLDAIHAIRRFPRVQAVVSYGRRVIGAQASAGTRYGTAGPTMGHASRTGACSEAAGLLLRANPAGHTSLTRRDKTQGQGNALTVWAQT
jgi:hypothetical protein